MRVGVLGATGTAGSAVAAELRSRGHEVVALGRRRADRHVDVVSGEGLDDAFAGLDAVVECLNAKGTKPEVVRPVLVDGVRAALAAAARAGVAHAVSLSIVGCDRVPLGYYRVKVEQEEVVRAAALPTTVVRATQFHQLIDYALGATKRLGDHPGAAARPPAGRPRRRGHRARRGRRARARAPTRRSPARRSSSCATWRGTWRAARGSRRPVVPVPALGATLTAIAAGGLTDRDAARGARTWAEFLSG